VRARILFLLLVLAGAAACLVSMLRATGGALSMPLDDAFIFFQYARRVVEGAPLTYQAGDPVTMGATSLLTVLVDAAGYVVGFRGEAMVLFALLLGAACFAWAAFSAYTLGRRLCPSTAWAPPVLILLCGPLVWGFLSGMDLPLFAALALAFAARWPEPGQPPPRSLFVIGALLGLARPDAVFLVFPAALLGLRFVPARRGWWALPVAFTVFPFVLQWALTGSPQSASMDVKSVLGRPGLSLESWLVQGIAQLRFIVDGVFNSAAPGDPLEMAANNRSAAGLYLIPFASLLLALGLAPGAWVEARARRPGLHLLLAVWIVLLVVAQVLTVPANWHWNRYLMPVYALALPGIAVGLERAGRWVNAAWPELSAGDGGRVLCGLAVLLSLPSAAYFAIAYGRNCADIRFQHIELAGRLNAIPGMDASTVVGVHDVGALTYFGRYHVLDIEGLADPRFRKASRLHAAGVWEAIQAIPQNERPQYLAVYTNWYDRDFLSAQQLLFAQRQFQPSIAAGNPITVYRANWEAPFADPLDPQVRARLEGWRRVTMVNTADLESERAAGYRFQVLDDAYEDLLRRLPTADLGDSSQPVVTDGGRLISGGESFVADVPAGVRARLVLRSHAPFRLRVLVDGVEAGVWTAPGGGNAWNESVFDLPAAPRANPRIEVRSDDPHHSAYGSFRYWVYVPREG